MKLQLAEAFGQAVSEILRNLVIFCRSFDTVYPMYHMMHGMRPGIRNHSHFIIYFPDLDEGKICRKTFVWNIYGTSAITKDHGAD